MPQLLGEDFTPVFMEVPLFFIFGWRAGEKIDVTVEGNIYILNCNENVNNLSNEKIIEV